MKLRNTALPFIFYRIGNGSQISFWLDPWWQGKALATSAKDPIIRNSRSSASANVQNFISSGDWVFPDFGNNLDMLSWLSSFNPPTVDPTKVDVILWNDTDVSKVDTMSIWECIRNRNNIVDWHSGVWLQTIIKRHIFTNWLLSHGRLNTLDRLEMFGMEVELHCCLCAGGTENAQHLFLSCPYSQFILNKICMQNMNIDIDFTISWNQFLLSLISIQQRKKRVVALLAAQDFVYHLWRESNSRMHNGKVSHPRKVLQIILTELRARVSSVRWFNVSLNPEFSVWLS